MGYYPTFIELDGRSCVVVGGGTVSERKVEGLLAAGAAVTVVSPTLTEGLRKLLERGVISQLARGYEAGDLKKYDIAFVATDDPNTNDAIYNEARSRRVWINCADDPRHCDFILPAVVRRGDITIAISTGGASPALARAIREEIEAYFSADYIEMAHVVAEVRRELQAQSLPVSSERWNKVLTGNFRRLIEAGKREEAKRLLRVQLGVGSCA